MATTTRSPERPRMTLMALVGLALLGALAPGWVGASCPPPASEPLTLATLVTVRDLVLQAERQRERPPDTEVWRLFETGVLPVPPVQFWPPSGLTPLAIRGHWLWLPMEEPARIVFDADGDGVTDVELGGYGELRHTYAQPGRYAATVEVHAGDGTVRRHTTPITVLDPAAFEAALQARWATLKAALARGDIPAALDCVHTSVRDPLRRVFTELFGGPTPTRVEDVLTTLTPAHPGPGAAEFSMARRDATGADEAFLIRFEADADGVWRLAWL